MRKFRDDVAKVTFFPANGMKDQQPYRCMYAVLQCSAIQGIMICLIQYNVM